MNFLRIDHLSHWTKNLLTSLKSYYRNVTRRSSVSLICVFLGIVFILLDILFGTSSFRPLPIHFAPAEVLIKGHVVGLPKYSHKSQSFLLRLAEEPLDEYKLKQVKVSWYYPDEMVRPGEMWSFRVRLKPLKPYLNPGSFDVRQWSFTKNIGAQANVIQVEGVKPEESQLFSVSRLRWKLKEQLKSQYGHLEHWGLINALIFGDRSDIPAETKKLLASSGTAHLFVVSGLHIGLIFGVVFFIARWICIPFIYSSSHHYFYSRFFLAASIAYFYALIAGFGVATQRSLWMLILGTIFFTRLGVTRPLMVCFFSGLMIWMSGSNIESSPAFWLSFTAVLALVVTFSSRYKPFAFLNSLLISQWVVFIALCPILYLLLLPVSPLSTVVNFIAVPLMGVIIMPLLMITIVVTLISFSVSGVLMVMVHFGLNTLIKLMTLSADHLQISFPPFSELTFLSMLIASLWLLMPKGLNKKILVIFLMLPLWFPKRTTPQYGDVALTALDVGQGLSVHIATENHNVLFDTGPSYESGFNVGEAVIAPYLRYNGVKKLDEVLISHGDIDHVGGLKGLNESIKIERLITNAAIHLNIPKTPCVNGKSWWLDGVLFEILYPINALGKDSNNSSCVLKVSANNGHFLLTGDIEEEAELSLFNIHSWDKFKADVIIIPHHGSETSSTIGLINRVMPKYGVISAGLWNRFHHPHSSVVERYRSRGVEIINTANVGAITFERDSRLNVLKLKVFSEKSHGL